MLPQEKNNEMEHLTKVLSALRELYYKKKEQLEELKDEIEEIREILNDLNAVISDKSFKSADQILSKTADEYFTESIPEEKMKGTKIKRKIFCKKDQKDQLLAILNLVDMNKVEIKFLNPEDLHIQETSEKFIKTFLKGALLEIKGNNPDLSLEYQYFKNTDIIERIIVNNLKSIKNYDLITEKVKELIES
jgi:hypothetical protein